MLCECVVGKQVLFSAIQNENNVIDLTLMYGLYVGISVRKGVSRILNISLSTHKLLALPEWDLKNPGTAVEIFSRPTCASSLRVGSAPHIIAIQDHHGSKPHTSGGASILLRSETQVATRMMLGPRCAPTRSPLQTPRHQISRREAFLLSSCSAQGNSSISVG